MQVVFCTTAKGRTPHLARTLPKNLADNPDAKFVVLSYNDQDGLADYLKANHIRDMESGHLTVYQYKEPVPFRMAHAKNMAHRCGILEGGDILVNLDADNFIGPGFSKYVAERFQSQDNIFLWSRMVKEGPGRLPRGISGRIAMTKRDFLLLGGYDEKFSIYSPDDKDANQRLRRLGLDGLEIDPKYLQAILHNDKMRYREYPEAQACTCDDFRLAQDGPAVVNGGKIGCGTVYRNFSTVPLVLGPVPCRIFGIGMHKTATTSLHRALSILGYKSAHWPSAHWAKQVWRDMNQLGRSPLLERYHAACDLPIPVLYRKLDSAYPGSKFILTVRDENRWLESIREHWSFNNPFRFQWDNDPFSHRIHKIIYGSTEFDGPKFLARYRKHNAEVLEYFKDRPSDLLVMEMDKGAGWLELCWFLFHDIPSVPYPRRNVKRQPQSEPAAVGEPTWVI